MTRRPAHTPGRSALYAWLLASAEEEALHPVPRPGVFDRLTSLRAGRPVDVCAGDLPAWARSAEPVRWSRRATVTITGATEFYDDDGSAWLAESGL